MDEMNEMPVSIKYCIRLYIDAEEIFDEQCDIYGPLSIVMHTVFRQFKTFKVGQSQ